MVKLRKEGTPHRFIALWKHSLLSSHFEFLPDKAQEWLHCQIQVQIPILSLLHNLPHFALPGRFGQSPRLNLLKRDSMACRTPVRKGHRLKVGRVLGRNQFSAAVFLFVFDFFLLNSTENFGYWWAVLAKKVPHSRMFIGDWLHDDRTKQRFMSVASPMKCEALVLFDVNVCYTYTQHVRLHPLETQKNPT